MYVGKSYRFFDFVVWTRRTLYVLIALNIVLVSLYQLAGYHWLMVPWSIAFLVGTTVAFMTAFKSTQVYGRSGEAQQVWASIAGLSRVWGSLCRDVTGDVEVARQLMYRHLAWLTVLRYEMRDTKAWESMQSGPNAEYRKRYAVPEKESSLREQLIKYLPPQEVARLLVSSGKATQALALQSEALKRHLGEGRIAQNVFFDLQKMLREFHVEQARTERIKNNPYLRQYATVNTIFVRILALLLPLGIIAELERINGLVDGAMRGHMVWLAIPLSVLVTWMYLSLDQVSESSSNPFEGGANDVPISQICRSVEIDFREMLGERDVPVQRHSDNAIVM